MEENGLVPLFQKENQVPQLPAPSYPTEYTMENKDADADTLYTMENKDADTD